MSTRVAETEIECLKILLSSNFFYVIFRINLIKETWEDFFYIKKIISLLLFLLLTQRTGNKFSWKWKIFCAFSVLITAFVKVVAKDRFEIFTEFMFKLKKESKVVFFFAFSSRYTYCFRAGFLVSKNLGGEQQEQQQATNTTEKTGYFKFKLLLLEIII